LSGAFLFPLYEVNAQYRLAGAQFFVVVQEGVAKMEVAKEVLKSSKVVESASLSLGSPAVQFNLRSDKLYQSGHSSDEAINAYILSLTMTTLKCTGLR